MTTRVMHHLRLAFPPIALMYIGDILLNLLIAVSGVIMFKIGILLLA